MCQDKAVFGQSLVVPTYVLWLIYYILPLFKKNGNLASGDDKRFLVLTKSIYKSIDVYDAQ